VARTSTPGRREALLAAGEQVFAARGADRATVEEVTSAAGMAKGTFYLYFRSKTDLLCALRQRFAQELADAVAPQPGPDGQPDWPSVARERLTAAADAFFVNSQRHEVLFHDERIEGPGADRVDWSEATVRALADLVQRGTAAGAFRVGDPELTAVALFHGLYGLFHYGLHCSASPDRERALRVAWEFVSRTLGIAGPSLRANARPPATATPARRPRP